MKTKSHHDRTHFDAEPHGLKCFDCLHMAVVQHGDTLICQHCGTAWAGNGLKCFDCSHLAVVQHGDTLICQHCGAAWAGISKSQYAFASMVHTIQHATPKLMVAEVKANISAMNAQFLSLKPRKHAEWQTAVDLARALCVVAEGQRFRLVESTPAVDGARCREILVCGERRGVVPGRHVADQMAQLLAES